MKERVKNAIALVIVFPVILFFTVLDLLGILGIRKAR